MPLPKIEHPLYEIFLKSLDRNVKFRPFLVKEEKILLMAKESKDIGDIRLAIKQIIQNCCAEDGIDVEKLPLFDIEMIFVKLRAKSVGETVKLAFTCNNRVGDEACGAETDYTLNIDKIKYKVPEGHDSKVMITDKMGIKLKYPTLALNVLVDENEDEYVTMIRGIVENIEYVFDENSVYKAEELGKETLIELIDNLTVEAMVKIQNFFSTSPSVVLEDDVKCSKCGFEHHLKTEGLIDFFT
jgi:hypothetical protein